MTIIKWILSVVFGLLAIANLSAALKGDFIPFILFVLAAALVLPPLKSAIPQGLAFLRASALRIFLSIVLAFVALGMLGGSLVSLSNVAVCPASDQGCEANQPLFLEGQTSVTVSAELNEGEAADVEALAVALNYVPAPGVETPVLDEVITVEGEGTDVAITLEDLDLSVGSYELKVEPAVESDRDTLAKTLTFTVWPTQEEIDKRSAEDIDIGDFSDEITEFYVCVTPPGEDDFCEESEATLPAGTTSFMADSVFRNPVGENAQLLLIWRYYLEDEAGDIVPEVLDTELINVEVETSRQGFSLLFEEGYPAGKYDVISIVNEPSAKPVRAEFSIAE